jgi:peroxiredoxin
MSQAQRRPAGDPRKLLIFVTLTLIAIGIVLAVALGSRVPKAAVTPEVPTAHLSVGDVAPDFSAATTQGPFALADAKGKPVLLEVLATWCPHCQREVATLNSLYGKYKDKVAFVAVTGSPLAIDQQSPASQADLIAFQQAFKAQYPMAYDGDLTVAKKYYNAGFPTIVIIGKDGKIAYLQSGELPEAELASAIDGALAGKPAKAR